MSAIKGNPSNDFKEQNPILSNIGYFKTVYDNNKKENASKICWSMFMIEEADVELNPLARIANRDHRISEVQKTYYKIDADSEEYKTLVSDYSKFSLSKEEALYRIHVSKFEELTAFLDQLSLDVDKQFDQYIKIMERLDKMWKGLEIVREKMIESKSKTNLRGNAQQSAREKRKR
jgi:hypothetical protein